MTETSNHIESYVPSKNFRSRNRLINDNFDIIVTLILVITFIIVAYPLYFIVIASISDPVLVTTGRVILYPRGMSFLAYETLIQRSDLWIGYRNTFFYTICGTAIGLAITMLAAFPLSFKLPGKKFIAVFFMLVMFFSGGLVPQYLWLRSLGFVNNPLSVILLGSFSIYNLIITITFLSSTIPDEMYEAARIDGCNYGQMFTSIAIPLSKAIMAVLVLYIAVYHWNSYFTAMIYLTKRNLLTLSLVLRNILIMADFEQVSAQDPETIEAAVRFSELIKYAVIIVACIPIMCLYPFIQRYFIKGVMIGAIKG